MMAGKNNTYLNSYLEFDETRRSIGTQDGFTFAFGIGSLEKEATGIDQWADYGTLKAQYETWNLTSREFETVKTRPCTLADFGLADGEQTFYDVNPIQKEAFEKQSKGLQCLDQEIEIKGTTNSQQGQLVNVVFERCNPSVRSTCKTATQVKEWLKQNQIFFIYNRKEFNSDEFGDRTFLTGSFLERVPISIADQQMMQFSISSASLTFKDSYWPGGKTTEEYLVVNRDYPMPYYS